MLTFRSTSIASASPGPSAQAITTSSQPEILVTKNGYGILDGDATPAPGDGTDFGTIVLGSAAATQTYTVKNTGTATLTLSGLTVPAGFSVVEGLAATLAPGASDTFTVRLNSGSAGLWTGDIQFQTNDSDEASYNFRVQGSVARLGIDQGQTTITELTPTEITRIDNLLYGTQWGSAPGTGVTLTYSFSTASSVFTATHEVDGQASHEPIAMTQAQKAAAVAAMQALSAVCNIQFVEVSDSATQAGDIRWTANNAPSQKTADAVLPTAGDASSGDIWFSASGYASFERASYEYQSFIHELGHAVGLNHPHEGLPAPVYGEDQLQYTVMSYRSYLDAPLNGYLTTVFPTSYMLNDILTLQYLYGANTSTHSGNDTYRWAADVSIAECLWDGGGVDTLDASNQLQACELDLNAGQFSSIGKPFNNGDDSNPYLVNDYLSIAYNTVIENAYGSAYSDAIYGNDVANLLKGNAGNDTLDGAAGQDTLDGGSGNDSMLGGDGSDTYYVNTTGDKVVETNTTSTGGTDLVLSSITNYTLGSAIENGRINTANAANLTGNGLNNVLYAGAGNNVLNGGSGSDTVHYGYASAGVTVNLGVATAQATGGSGSDTLNAIENLMGSKYGDRLTGNTAANRLNGDAGNDALSGGSGNDTLIGGAGKDSLTGGAGNDVFDFNALSELGLGSTARDVITDFAAGADKIDLSTIDANTALAGDQAFALVSSFTTTAGQVRYAGGILYLNTDTDTAAEYEIQLTGTTAPAALTAANLVL